MDKSTIQNHNRYMTAFLEEFGFGDEVKSALQDAFDRVFGDQDAARLFDEIRRRFEQSPDERFFYLIENADKIAATCAISPYTAYLLVLILLSESSKRIYAERKVSLEMWRRNMRDLRYTSDACLLVKGVYGTDSPRWYERFFNATRFTFGKLQFELCALGKPYQKDDLSLSPDDQAIFIHIPRTGERLLPEDVDASAQAAAAFFKERYGTRRTVFACHSWILYPENKNILSAGSNLYSFISRFEIIDVVEDAEHKELWRLFDKEYNGDPDDLPQDSSLRRAYVQRLKENKPLGVALGVWVYRQ
ncbi:MAG: hypothetical protein J5765_00475 [Clostridia bacterium]|nr:hypothetical protein [Clostridia bacterium]